jgi:hypothetical protein
LYISLDVGGEIAPSKHPFGRWIGIELTVFALPILHDISTPFAAFDDGVTGSAVEATTCLLHKNTVDTRFNRDTFHRCSLSFFISTPDTYTAFTRQQNCLLAPALRPPSSEEESL